MPGIKVQILILVIRVSVQTIFTIVLVAENLSQKILHSGRKIHLGDLLASPMMDASIASGNTRYSALEEMFTKELL